MEKRIQLGALLASVTTAYNQHATDVFKLHQLAPTQARILLMLWLGKGLKMSDIAKSLDLEASNVTVIIDKLEMLGLIKRQASINDRRVKTISFTRRGKRLAKALIEEVTNLPALRALTSDEIDQLIVLFTKLVQTSPQDDK